VVANVPLDVAGWQLQCGEVQPDLIVDLRQPDAFSKARMHGAINIPYEQLQLRGVAELTARGHVLVVDPGGARAAEMAVWLRRHGIAASYLVGGYAQWTGPLERG
jgi:rhodanese-related sulfurtransferase